MKKSNDGKKHQSFLSNKSLIDTFNNAISGLIMAVRSERNMKIHLTAAILVCLSTIFLDFSKIELAILTVCIVMVFVAEFINTAIEEIVDLQTQGRYSKVAKTVKDIAAGAVFITAVASVLVAYLIMYDKIKGIFLGKPLAIKRVFASTSHLIFIAISLILILVVLLKSIFFKKHTTHLQGGTVSGHSALSFCLATIAAILAKNFEVTILSYILALLVAESRTEAKIHTFREVVIGAVLGIFIALLLFYNYL
ncbi:MAG: diacylglycerol kinase [Tissierellia bacterium]|nr:diacylglycerol kinase [Tissierellia bacterium]